MPRVKVNPNAKAPEFITVAPGEYRMKFKRLEKDACKESQKTPGLFYTKMMLEHLTPSEQILDMNNQPLKPTESAGAVFIMFMMNEEYQGTLRQAIEATGQAWPTDPNLEIDEFWIQDALDGREVVAKLKTSQYQGNWKNEVQRFIVPETV